MRRLPSMPTTAFEIEEEDDDQAPSWLALLIEGRSVAEKRLAIQELTRSLFLAKALAGRLAVVESIRLNLIALARCHGSSNRNENSQCRERQYEPWKPPAEPGPKKKPGPKTAPKNKKTKTAGSNGRQLRAECR